MRIAIISDIHANLPALEETLKSIEKKGIDIIYCLGDLVGYNIWPNAVISEIRKRRIPTIAGNHDVKAVQVQHNKDVADTVDFAYKIIGKEHIEYLAELPSHLRLEFQLKEDSFVVLMVHGSPYSNTEYLFEDKCEEEYRNIFIDTGADIILCGHTHKPYHRILNGKESDKIYHAINTGSVGKPKDGDPRSCYAILTIDKESNLSKKETIKVEFVRVKYDVEKAAQAIENCDLPASYAHMLRKAY